MAKTAQDESHERRPYPPLRFIEDHQLTPYIGLVPANEVQEWMQRQIIDDSGSLFNPDHGHLADADLRFMWASSAFEKKGAMCSAKLKRWRCAPAAGRRPEWNSRCMSGSARCRNSSSRWLPTTAHSVLMLSSAPGRA